MSEEEVIKFDGTGGAADAEKPTLKTISRLSGLAVPTVSRALNDAPDIGAETKKLVRRIADEVGYVPNRAGVRLRTGRTNVISLILSTEHDMMNHTARLIASVAATLRNTPLHLIITPYFQGEDPMRAVRYVVETGSADAVIINQTEPDDIRVRYLMEKKFPFATHGRTNFAAHHPYFDFDNEEFGRIGVRKLAENGRRKILVIAPPRGQNYAENLIVGVTDEALKIGAEVILSTKATSDSSSDDARAAVQAHLADRPDIDGIICASTTAAMSAVAGLEAHGLVLGRDVDLFAKEAVPFLKLFRKDIISLNEDVRKAGEFLALAAMQAIREPNLPPMQGLDVPHG